jgi:hypothetical protein
METILTVVGSVAAAFITAYITTVVKLQQEHVLDIDRELRDARIKAYKRPWGALKTLSMHSPEPPSYGELEDIVGDLTDWYYTEGGVYLTTHSQPAFRACVESIKKVSRTKQGASGGRIGDETHELLFDVGSAFRTQMTLDLGSRFESEFRTQRHRWHRFKAKRKSKRARKELLRRQSKD